MFTSDIESNTKQRSCEDAVFSATVVRAEKHKKSIEKKHKEGWKIKMPLNYLSDLKKNLHACQVQYQQMFGILITGLQPI